MKIKMKVKTIILLSLGTLIFILGIIPYANLKLANVFNEDKPAIAGKLYENYLKYPTGLKKDEALYKSAENTMGVFRRYNIMLGMKSGEELLDENTVMESIRKYEEVIKNYPESQYYTKSYMGLLESYIYIGNEDKLKEWIKWGERKTGEINELAKIYKSYDYAVNRDYERAEKILESYSLGNKDIDYAYYFLKGHIAFLREDYDLALEYYNKATKGGWKGSPNLFGNMALVGRPSWLKELDFINGENKIRGRITSDGVGIPFVEVYLKYPGGGYRTIGGNFIAITDKDGYYETVGIKDGRYEIGIGIGSPILFDKVYLEKTYYNIDLSQDMDIDFKLVSPMEIRNPENVQITKNNKFTIEWKEVEGAEFYSISVVGFEDPYKKEGGTMTVTIPEINGDIRLKGNRAVFDLDVIKDAGMGFSSEGDEWIISHHAILGYFYKEIETPIIVNAYDKDWNMLNSSMPLIGYYEDVPSIKVEGNLSEGEKLILKRDYENAINHYEDILIQDKNNEEALEYLTRLYTIGWKKGMKDLDKAFEYGLRLSEIRGNKDTVLAIINSMDSQEKREYNGSIKEIFDSMHEEEMTQKAYYLRGDYYRSNGEFEKARNHMELSNHYFLAQDIIYIDLYLGENQRAIDFLGRRDTRLHYMSKEKLIEGIEILDKMDKNHREYVRFREYLYSLLMREDKYEERKDKFRDVQGNIKNPGIKTILYEIKLDNHW